MAKPQDLRWTTEERRQLYAILKENAGAGKLDWNSVLREALKRNTSEHFLENFRTGKIAIRDAARIHDYLTQSHPEVASEFESAFHSPPVWETFLLRHRTLGSLELQRPDGYQHPRRMPAPDVAAHSRSVIVLG